jgi:tetratricopeptide (TPR) repeat protein
VALLGLRPYLRSRPSHREFATSAILDSSPTDRLQAGRDALARGGWEEARVCFESSLKDAESPEALEGLGMACWWLEDYATGIDARERAYRLFRRADDGRAAARVAIWLSNDYADFRGETAIANGWIQRAERLLDGVAPSPEHALLAYQKAHVALMGQRDPVAARRLSQEAAAIARSVGPADMEMLGVALEGLAMVTEGEVAEGMSRLDEATAAATAGELSDPAMIGTACCYLIRACEQVHDYDRASVEVHPPLLRLPDPVRLAAHSPGRVGRGRTGDRGPSPARGTGATPGGTHRADPARRSATPAGTLGRG